MTDLPVIRDSYRGLSEASDGRSCFVAYDIDGEQPLGLKAGDEFIARGEGIDVIATVHEVRHSEREADYVILWLPSR